MEEIKQTAEIDDKMIFAQNLTFFRKKLGLSQTTLGQKIQYSNKNISKWENGETTPDIFTIKKLAAIFEVPVDTLINPLSEESKDAIKTTKAVPLRWKIYMLLLVESIIFLTTTILFYILQVNKTELNFPAAYVFVYALPVYTLGVFIFLCCVQKRVNILTLSLFGWLIAVCIHITFLKIPDIWYIYLFAVAYQMFAIFLAKLINSGKMIKLNKLIIRYRNRHKNKEQKESKD